MRAIELQIAKECVKVDDFRRLEDRMTNRFEKVEHTINNSRAEDGPGGEGSRPRHAAEVRR